MTLFNRQTAGGRCPCGAEHAACGPPSDSVGVDEHIEEVAAVSGPLKKYRYTTESGASTVIKLNAVDAEQHGLTDADLADAPEAGEKAVAAAPNKARTSASNKARSSRSKGGEGGGS